MTPAVQLQYGRPLPKGDLFEGLYIDDHVIIGRMKKHLLNSPALGPDDELLAKSRKAYEAVGLPRSEKKAFERQQVFTVWGATVDGPAGKCGAPPERRGELFVLAILQLAARATSRQTMESMLGSFVHPFAHAKLHMCLLGKTYRWVSGLKNQRLVELPWEVAQ